MRDYPQELNTWDDVLFVVANFPREKWYNDVANLIAEDQVKAWFWDHELASKEEGIEDATHKIVEMDEHTAEGEVKKYIQYILKYNLTCPLARMRFCHTDAELEAAIADVQAILETGKVA